MVFQYLPVIALSLLPVRRKKTLSLGDPLDIPGKQTMVAYPTDATTVLIELHTLSTARGFDIPGARIDTVRSMSYGARHT